MIANWKGLFIVSCQALEDEPLHSSFIMGRMALAAKQGGADAIRAQSKEDIIEIKKVTGLPVIGIVKRTYSDSEVFITPTQKEIMELLESDCEMIALDATLRNRPNNESLENLVKQIHEGGRLAMADCSTFEECLNAEKIGFDCVSTTLCGYTSYSEKYDGPNLPLLKKACNELTIPVIGEGKINTPKDLEDVLNCGVYACVVGSAITRPQLITASFAKVYKNKGRN